METIEEVIKEKSNDNMKHISCLVLFFVLEAFCSAAAQKTAVFNWTDPASLTPAFSAPDANNRYGEYVGGTVFGGDGATFSVDDSGVSEQSRRARFLFNYTTRTVELRAYLDSDIVIRAAEGRTLSTIVLEGPETDEYYISMTEPAEGVVYTPAADYMTGTWTLPAGTVEARLQVRVRMECTRARITTADQAAVDAITADANNAPAVWFTLQGIPLPSAPTVPGLYLRRSGSDTRRILIP